MNFNELWGKSTPNSWARVPRGPMAAAVGAFLFGSTGFMATMGIAGVSLATMTGFLITTAITTWALSALAPKPGGQGSSRGLLGNSREAAGSFDIVYGEVRKGGVITFMETSDRIDGSGKRRYNDYLHSIIVLAGHEVEEIGSIYLNDEIVNIDANGYVTGDRWKSLIRIKKHLGSPNQAADTDLVSETSVTSAFRGRGIAYLYVRMDWDKDVFASGTPTITAQVKGRKVFDPRTSTTAWSDNAALCIRDYLQQPFGVNSIQSPNSLLSNTWAIGANVCDTLVAKKGGTSEKRYTINGVVSTATSPRENIQKMLTACGGTLFWGQGQWQFKAGYFPAGPYVRLGADDLRSNIDLVTKNSRKENFNAVTGLFVDKSQGYTEVEYPKVSSAVFLARDNGQDNVLDVSLPLTVSSSTAQRLGKMAMFRNREEIVISADFSPKAANVKVGDVVQFTLDRYGFSNKFFEVITWKPVADNGELKFSLVLKETSAAAYDWNAEEEDILGNNTNLPNPLEGLSITNLAVTNNQVLQNDGTYLGQVTLSWDEAASAFVEKYDVQWRRSTESSWSATSTNQNSLVIPSIVSGVLYSYRVRAVSSAGFTGPWESLSTSVIGKTTAPGTPTNFTATGAYRSVNLKWTNPTDKDFAKVEIWKSDTNSNISSASKIGESGSDVYIDGPITPNVPGWYFLRAVNRSGLFSPFTTARQAHAMFVGDNDVDIDVKELLNDAGLSAVEVVNSLPTTGNFNGRTVYLTTDQTLYTWNGTQWKSATFDQDALSLELNNFPQNLRPMEVLGALPTTGNFTGRMVYLTTNGKVYRYNGTAFTAAYSASDMAGAITSTQIGPNEIKTPNLDANSITADKMGANSVSAGAIQAGAIATDKLQAGSVVASKMMVADFSNLLINNWTGGDFDSWGTNGNVVVQNRTDSVFVTGGFAGNMVVYTGGEGWIRSGSASVTAGETFYLEIWTRRSSTAVPDGNTLVQARWVLNDGTSTYSTIGSSSDLNNVKISKIVTAPENATNVSMWIRPNVSGTTGQVFLARPVIRRAANSELIVDGAIKADHMSVNSVTAGVIAAGAINAAALFVDGVITAAKLNTDSLAVSGISIFGGTLQSNNFNATNGTGWRITQAGTMNLPNAVITTAKIADLAVDTLKIADSAVTVGYYTTLNGGSAGGSDNYYDPFTFNIQGPGRAIIRPKVKSFTRGGGVTDTATSTLQLNGTDICSYSSVPENSGGGSINFRIVSDVAMDTVPLQQGNNVFRLKHNRMTSASWTLDIFAFKK